MKIFLGTFAGFMFVQSALADGMYPPFVWDYSQSISAFDNPNNLVSEGVILTASAPDSNIGITMSMDIENRGEIIGNLVALDDFHVRINNKGIIDGSVIAPHVLQIVTTPDGANKFTVVSNDFSVHVDGVHDGVRLTDIQNLGAGVVKFKNSNIIIDDFKDWQLWDANVSWVGSNTLSINNLYTVESGVYLSHVTQDTVLNVLTLDEDKLYRIDLLPDIYGKMLRVVRETDYQRIFDDGRGVFLANLRATNPNDKMLMAMDGATNMNGLHNAMNASYRFNPAILMRPVKQINNFAKMDILVDETVSGGGVVPFYMTSANTHDVGARGYVNTAYDNYVLRFGVHLNKFEYEDAINNFAGASYGADVGVKKRFNKFVVDGYLGADLINFDADYIYTDGGIQNNPSGYALYGGIDAVYDYNVSDDLIVSPFMGGALNRYNVISSNENDVDLRGGGMARYLFTVDGIKYEYGALVGLMMNGDVFGNLKIGFESLVDDAGASINLGMYQDEYVTSYRASIDAHVLF